MTGKRWMRWTVLAVIAMLLAACASGPVRRVSEPAARIQQLTVLADGNWSVDLRIENFSSIPMQFDAVDLKWTVGSQHAGSLVATPALTIGPESADVVTVAFSPSVEAKLMVADALTGQRGVDYVLEGGVTATPDEQRPREFKVRHSSRLSPAPGLPGVLR